jgi:homoserine dehydrogenase
MKAIQAGLLGIGTVGTGVHNVLKRNQEEIKRRAGRGIEITMVADLDTARAQSIVGPGVQVVNDARAVIANPDIDIVIELIGGYGIARQLVMEAIEAGKHVVTANKALLAVHGTEIFAAAHRRGVMVAFEAAVAGGIPIIKALREGLTANSIEWIAGIINGTTNFILSEMRDKGPGLRRRPEGRAAPGLCRGRPTFDIEGRGRGAQGHHHVGHRLRHPGAVRQGLCRGHHQAGRAGHPLRRAAGLPHQASGHHQAHGQGHRAASAPGAGAGQAADRQRRRRDECR